MASLKGLQGTPEVPAVRTRLLQVAPSDGPRAPAGARGSLATICSVVAAHWVLYLVIFGGAAAFAIILPSVWPYMQRFDFPLTYLGSVVASYSVGQMLSAPIMGWLSHRVSPLVVIQASLWLSVAGNLGYACIELLPVPLLWFILTRFVAGCSAGNVAVIRSYLVQSVADAQSESAHSTTVALALVTGIQGVGFILGPGFAAVFSRIDLELGPFRLDSSTMPGVFCGGLSLLVMLPLYLHFRRHSARSVGPYRRLADEGPLQSDAITAQSLQAFAAGAQRADGRSQSECLPSRPSGVPSPHSSPRGRSRPFSAYSAYDGALSDRSSLGEGREWSQDLLQGAAGLAVGSGAAMGLAGGPEIDPEDGADIAEESSSDISSAAGAGTVAPARRAAAAIGAGAESSAADGLQAPLAVSRRSRVIGSVLCCLGVFFAALVFTVFETVMTPYTQAAYGWSIGFNGIMFSLLGLLSLVVQVLILFHRRVSDQTIVIGGLALQALSMLCFLSWRASYAPLGQFLAGAILLVVGYSASNSLIYPVFARLHPPQSQGFKMGSLTSAASAARIIGPLAIAPAFSSYHGALVFLPIAAGLVCCVCAPMLLCRRHLAGARP